MHTAELTAYGTMALALTGIARVAGLLPTIAIGAALLFVILHDRKQAAS